MSDWKSARSRGSLDEIVVWKKTHRNFGTRPITAQNFPDQAQDRLVADFATQLFKQNAVINIREEFAHVALQHVLISVNQFPATLTRSRRSFAYLAGKASSNKSPHEDGCDHVAQRVMNHAVPERRSRDEASFRLANLKESVARGSVCSRQELFA